jgi:hypothetical protein
MRKGKGKEAKLCYGAHALMENKNGLLVDVRVTEATGTAEEEAAEEMLKRQGRRGIKPKTVGGDKGYDTNGFVSLLRSRKITPHVAANTKRRGGSAIDGRTTRHAGYSISQRVRKRIEEIYGWIKTVVKYFLCELHMIFIGPVKSDVFNIFEYKYNHYLKNNKKYIEKNIKNNNEFLYEVSYF